LCEFQKLTVGVHARERKGLLILRPTTERFERSATGQKIMTFMARVRRPLDGRGTMEMDERWGAEEILVQKENAMIRLTLAAAAAALMLGSVSFAIAEDQDKSAASPGHQMQEHGSKMGRASPIGSERNGRMAGVRDREDRQFRDEKVIVDRDRDHRTL